MRGLPAVGDHLGRAVPSWAWPDVPAAAILCRHDRLFPVAWLRQVVRHRLGIEPEEIDGGHTPGLSHPIELTNVLEHIRLETSPTLGRALTAVRPPREWQDGPMCVVSSVTDMPCYACSRACVTRPRKTPSSTWSGSVGCGVLGRISGAP